ncbi:conserved exported hypothetical protein [Vibrio crassostreae]|uniref:hypothetical protein n=1 Tax=Vibrio crassostreae TaxID=246167 RepID=UPI0010463073|nr:hypothetical protein [Vibrio crassostreae]TCN83456.1 hypothetical protein EDB37_101871 [Vibrio crassostreae]CAK2413352.1 conserved exported hypothetical protein [Vibrio crassostreae]CAK2422785.1 conserved exported hypothetical protein [Vibrio crassostreae]CAK3628862.1 conserved exported hypothetical protein [Vibrio crassostreae]CAK3808363.1 conserved exported hypothetical protein [Vibrio crassostreae]
MTNTLRTTWITVFSIIAMLVSSYASSSSALMADVMMAQGSPQSDCHHSESSNAVSDLSNMTTGCDISVAGGEHAAHATMPHHTSQQGHTEMTVSDDEVTTAHSSSISSHDDNMMGTHCLGGSDSIHNCCISVCSTASYPIQAVQAVNQFSFSLARFQSVTIGQKVTRAQSLLRPPAA